MILHHRTQTILHHIAQRQTRILPLPPNSLRQPQLIPHLPLPRDLEQPRKLLIIIDLLLHVEHGHSIRHMVDQLVERSLFLRFEFQIFFKPFRKLRIYFFSEVVSQGEGGEELGQVCEEGRGGEGPGEGAEREEEHPEFDLSVGDAGLDQAVHEDEVEKAV